jgi:hypothetical protein
VRTDDGLDARVCTSIGHDEDADGVDDACDTCPQLADNQADSDGDGIGDACDLAPTAQMVVMFDPFATIRPEWTFFGGTIMNDSYVVNSLGGGAGATLLQPPPGRETFEISGVVLATTGQPQITIGIYETTDRKYYCELYDNGSSHQLQLTYTFDGASFFNLGTVVFAQRLTSGPFRLILDHTPTNTTCIGEWGGERLSTGGTNQAITPNYFGLSVFQVSAELHSFIRLATP